MGQYYYIVNLDRKEYLDPYFFGNGLKLMEIALSSEGVLAGLAILLASSNGLGGGDLHEDAEFDDVPGRWCGERIVLAGDYDEHPESPGCNVYREISKDKKSNTEQLLDGIEGKLSWTDISPRVLGALLSDEWFRRRWLADVKENVWGRNEKTWTLARPNDPYPLGK